MSCKIDIFCHSVNVFCANLMLLYVFMCGERAATTTNVTARVLSMKKKNELVNIKEDVRESRRFTAG